MSNGETECLATAGSWRAAQGTGGCEGGAGGLDFSPLFVGRIAMNHTAISQALWMPIKSSNETAAVENSAAGMCAGGSAPHSLGINDGATVARSFQGFGKRVAPRRAVAKPVIRLAPRFPASDSTGPPRGTAR